MYIRKFKDEDIDVVMSIWFRATIVGHPFISEFYWRCNYNTVKKEYLPNSKTFVYEENNSIKGFISIVDDSYIGALFVDPKSQGRGVGKMLLDYVKKEYSDLTLSVYKDNKKAYRFYKKALFEPIEEGINEDSGFMEVLMKYTSREI
ncbi:MAG: N-acetyltransferase [Clostridium sp.]|uniref:N-acetyltransferase n=1 Tax=Clostridium sp. TaxID=1506 RepID=UPI0025C1D69F|nr:N-acetyltransferase [Clostridium sp.]MBS5927745.1 N-acetyltransferase [Clostridium sp.]